MMMLAQALLNTLPARSLEANSNNGASITKAEANTNIHPAPAKTTPARPDVTAVNPAWQVRWQLGP
jgi:hypothetical protein